MRKIWILLLTTLLIQQSFATPPIPPKGQRWIINEAFSDEFNGTALNDEKWHNYHPQWIGRPPGLFMKEAISVKDGYLQIRNSKLDRDSIIWNWNHTDTDTFSIGGGAVRSKSNQAFYGYYECRVKASNTSMSTTFWLSSDHTVKIPGCATGKEKYGLELDIQECVGRVDNPGNTWFTTGMHSNTHFHYTNCDGEKQTRSKGAKVDSDIPDASVFNTYGAYWKDANEVDFIFNDSEVNNVQFRTDILNEPFNFPMCMNLVTETYDWISTPHDENLNDDTKNTSYYDWVRSYVLVDVDEDNSSSNENLIVNGDFETGTDNGWTVGWGGNPREIDMSQPYEGTYCMHIGGAGAPEQILSLKPNTNYVLSAYAKAVKGNVTFGIKNNSSGQHLKDVKVSSSTYEKQELKFVTDDGSSFKVFYYAPSAADEGYIDNVVLMEDGASEPVDMVMFDEEVHFASKPASFNNAAPYIFEGVYMAGTNQELHLAILDNESNVIAEKVFSALAGYGLKDLSLTPSTQLLEGVSYTAQIHIRPVGSADNSTAFASDEFSFNVTNPKQLTMVLTDERTHQPISGGVVSLYEQVKNTDAEGKVVFNDIPIGDHTFSVVADGYKSLENSVLTLTTDTTMEIELEPQLYRADFYLKDSVSMAPIKAGRLTIDGTTKTTDGEGKVNFTLYYGNYSMQGFAQQYRKKSDSLEFRSNEGATMLLYRELTDVEFEVKLDESYFSSADLTLGDETRKTNIFGLVSFDDVPTHTVLKYAVNSDGKLWMNDSASFYNDTLVKIAVKSVSVHNVSGEVVAVYPNPVTSELYMDGIQEHTRYAIYQLNGVKVLDGIYSPSTSINVSDLENGTYIIKLGEKVSTSFVKR